MDEQRVKTADEVREVIHGKDKDAARAAINEYIANPVVAIPLDEEFPEMLPEPQREPVMDTSVEVIPKASEENEMPSVAPEGSQNGSPEIPEEPEEDATARYIKYLEEQVKEIESRFNNESAETAKLRHEVEEKQQLIDEAKQKIQNPVQTQTTSPVHNPDEDDEYVTDFEKNSRRMIEELKTLISQNPNDPRVIEIDQRLKNFEKKQTEIDENDRRKAEQKRREELDAKLYTDVRDFQEKYPEFTTPIDVKELNDKYMTFRDQLANVFAVSLDNEQAINVLESKYFKKFDNGEVFNQMASKGINPPENVDRLREIIKYNDLRNGVALDDMSGVKTPIKDKFGRQVKYGSIEEAFIIKNFATLKVDAFKDASVEIQHRLNNRNDSAVILDNSHTTPIGEKMSEQEARYYIGLKPHEARKLSPDQRVKWTEAYGMFGQAPPKIPGM